ncbi:gliding motility lipoprotein GldB [Paucihalobacter sp.]|uniref:gliding motility lipoprotein GldB n=1 Tax=Paucihalobacter sp. TaxID=2850405 RepID=UPI002FE2092A
MIKHIILVGLLIFLMSCDKQSDLEKKISKINVGLNIERFDRLFAKITEAELPKLKSEYPFLFSNWVPDSVWVETLKDTIQQELFEEVNQAFNDISEVELDIYKLFQHLKYYDKTFIEPRFITVTNNVRYRESVVVTDTIALVALDNYLGSEHHFYANIPEYLTENFKPSDIVVNLAEAYAEKHAYQPIRKTLLDEMIYFGKLLYFKEIMIPFKSDAEKIGYTEDQLTWAINNESEVWSYFIEHELLFSTDSKLPSRFITPAPFSKFYLEIDNDSPGRIGQYIGWQIVKAYMKQNKEVDLFKMMQTSAQEIFDNTKYKPNK